MINIVTLFMICYFNILLLIITFIALRVVLRCRIEDGPEHFRAAQLGRLGNKSGTDAAQPFHGGIPAGIHRDEDNPHTAKDSICWTNKNGRLQARIAV